jgi:hypothetical protein
MLLPEDSGTNANYAPTAKSTELTASEVLIGEYRDHSWLCSYLPAIPGTNTVQDPTWEFRDHCCLSGKKTAGYTPTWKARNQCWKVPAWKSMDHC